MGIFFTGTSTKRLHKVGTTYQKFSGGDGYRANRDGSFTNTRTGVTFRGSSRNPNVKWYSDGKDDSPRTVAKKDRVASKPTATATVKPAPITGGGSGPANDVVTVGPAQPAKAGGAGPATPVTSTKKSISGGNLVFSGPWSSEEARDFKPTKPRDYETRNGIPVNDGPTIVHGRPMPMGWIDWNSNPYWPTGEELENEHGELWGGVMSVGKFFFGDIPWNATRFGDHVGRNMKANLQDDRFDQYVKRQQSDPSTWTHPATKPVKRGHGLWD
jgi:hypothetical protein